mmetsp:Transcript_12273/g.40001  ORF Transcript_12273/g.40001 Transcript_12273/m.40001 type:complete len:87 (+) Transcript_12273:766-1026(+)
MTKRLAPDGVAKTGHALGQSHALGQPMTLLSHATASAGVPSGRTLPGIRERVTLRGGAPMALRKRSQPRGSQSPSVCLHGGRLMRM